MDLYERSLMNATSFKKWNTLFLRDRHFYEDSSFVRICQDNIHVDGDDLDIFLRDCGSPVPSCATEAVKKYCQGIPTSVLDLEAHETSLERPKAWLNDCEMSTGYSRRYHTRLTARQLYILLSAKVREALSAKRGYTRLINRSALGFYIFLT